MPTARAEDVNGEWPDLPKVPPPIEELGDNPTNTALLKALGTTLFAWGHVWPRAVQALEYLRRWTEQHDRDHGQGTVPPMRDRFDSTHKAASTVAGDVARAYEAELKNPSTPPIPSPQKLETLVDQRVAIEIARIKLEEDAAKWHAVDAERKAAEEERLLAAKKTAEEKRRRDVADEALARFNQRQKSKATWKALGAGAVALFTTIGWLLEHFGKK